MIQELQWSSTLHIKVPDAYLGDWGVEERMFEAVYCTRPDWAWSCWPKPPVLSTQDEFRQLGNSEKMKSQHWKDFPLPKKINRKEDKASCLPC